MQYIFLVLIALVHTSVQAENFHHSSEVNWFYQNPVEEKSKDPNIERRAAVDWGSGSVKVEVADVNKTSGEIVKKLAAAQIELRLRDDLEMSKDARLLT